MRIKRLSVIALSVLSLSLVSCSSNKDKRDAAYANEVMGHHNNKVPKSFLESTVHSLSEAEHVADRVFFKFACDRLDRTAKHSLKEQAEFIKKKGAKIVVEGHCDERGAKEYNLALGHRRADSVKSFLIENGVQASHITTVSFGKEKPEVNESNDNAWAANRRAVTVLK